MQCAAVTTQSGAIRDPPQLNDFELPLSRAIYQWKMKTNLTLLNIYTRVPMLYDVMKSSLPSAVTKCSTLKVVSTVVCFGS